MTPIETTYRGYRFRSRLEARWAVFFDALGLKWEYEAEGYATEAGWYLPDFVVHQPAWFGRPSHTHVEIKPHGASDISKPLALAKKVWESKTDGAVTVLIGAPDPDSTENLFWDGYWTGGHDGLQERRPFDPRHIRRWKFGLGQLILSRHGYAHVDDWIMGAFAAARSARF